jgi:response regulator of citrate/malate metabolism
MQSVNTINALILDDDRVASEVASALLRQRGVNVLRIADRVDAALTFLDDYQSKLQLVVADLYLPGCDGIEFLDLLRKRRFTAGVVILSGAGNTMLSAAHRLCVAYGLSLAGIVQKPVTGAKLDEVLRHVPPRAAPRITAPPVGADSVADGEPVGGPS